MSKILGKKCTIITKSGRRIDYTHITYLNMDGNSVQIAGESDVAGVRANVGDTHKVEGLEVMWFEFYVPKT